MTSSFRTRIARAAVVGGIGVAAVLGTAGAALAGPAVGAVLQPGGRVCTPVAFAGHKVVLNANSTAGGASYDLSRDGIAYVRFGPGSHQVTFGFSDAPGGIWPGAGNYQGCATNTSSGQIIAQLQMFVDKEVR
jgi:hypothetical protein